MENIFKCIHRNYSLSKTFMNIVDKNIGEKFFYGVQENSICKRNTKKFAQKICNILLAFVRDVI